MKKIVVAGNPNSGKTCLFNILTGSNQRVGNYAGVTVEFTEGKLELNDEQIALIDLPGTYSLTAYSQEELVTRDYILDEKPDLILNVIDASNLERNLYLTTQLLELNVPMLLVLNMYDICEKKGIDLDIEELEQLLGVRVVKTTASKNEGIDELKKVCFEAINNPILPRKISYPHELEEILPDLVQSIECHPELSANYIPQWFAIKLIEDDKAVIDKLSKYKNIDLIKKNLNTAKKHLLKHSGEEGSTAVVEARYAFASGVYRKVHRLTKAEHKMITNMIDNFICHKFFGWVVLFAIIYLMFKVVFQVSGEIEWIPVGVGNWVTPVDLFNLFFEYLSSLASNIETPWLKSMLVDGVIGGVGGVMGFVPLIFFMFLFLSVLEDSGYIARMAFLLDRILRVFGLQGKSILSLIISGGIPGGCAVPGVMATRTLREENDRLVTILVIPFMNCGAKMPVYGMLIAAFFPNKQGLVLSILFFLSWFFALCSAVVIRKFVVKGKQTPFVMELPLYHMPTIRGVLMDTWHRTWMYIKKAATVILAINIVLWAIMYYPQDHSLEEKKEAMIASVITQNNIQEKYKDLLTEDRNTIQKALGNDSEKCKRFLATKNEMIAIENSIAEEHLQNSYAGRLGRSLIFLSKYAGFDWRDNIALIGGFAAKEVIVSTLGTAYSMGSVEAEESESLSELIASSSLWSPVKAFAIMIFVMVYAPCLVTIATIKAETNSWKWPMFSLVYNTVVAYLLAVFVYQVGTYLIA
jgi:ferrous iron transport protein B